MTRLEQIDNDIEQSGKVAAKAHEKFLDRVDELKERVREAHAKAVESAREHGAQAVEALREHGTKAAIGTAIVLEIAKPAPFGELPPGYACPPSAETTITQAARVELREPTPESMTASEREAAAKETEREKQRHDEFVDAGDEFANELRRETDRKRGERLWEAMHPLQGEEPKQ